ncbi:hypothetical protein Hanom_Chr05g00454211 [Helianthus anomalus]
MNRTDPIFRVVNRFCILCLIGSRVRSGNGRVGSGFSFCSPLRTDCLCSNQKRSS